MSGRAPNCVLPRSAAERPKRPYQRTITEAYVCIRCKQAPQSGKAAQLRAQLRASCCLLCVYRLDCRLATAQFELNEEEARSVQSCIQLHHSLCSHRCRGCCYAMVHHGVCVSWASVLLPPAFFYQVWHSPCITHGTTVEKLWKF